MHTRTVLSALVLAFCISSATPAANIVWVSFHPGDSQPGTNAAAAGFTTAPDKAYTDLLATSGYTVTRYVQTATPDAALLNAADLVIISRSVNSASFQDAAATRWNTTITAPMMILGGYPIRQNRLGLSTGNTIPDTTGDIRLTANDPAHPIFKGISLTGNTMANPYAGVVRHPTTNALMRGISIVTEAANANGTVLATVAAGSAHSAIGAMVIAEWPAGVTVTHANGAGTDVLAGPRLVFLTGSRETDGVNSETAGYYDLHPDGAAMFINAVRYMLGEKGDEASNPNPQAGAVDVLRDTILSWTPGESAVTHDVYFGTDADAVANATSANPMGVLASQGQDANTYDPAGALEFGRRYSWRVDEVGGAPDFAVVKGSVWSFTVEPYAYAIENVIATASGTRSGFGGPQTTVDGSGLDADDLHSTTDLDMWFSNDAVPTWIQYEFDQAYGLQEMWVWNYNGTLESMFPFGAKDVTVEYSLDGETWTELADAPEFAKAPGTSGYAHETTVDFGGAMAKFVRLTINSNWSGLATTGLSEVRFFYVPVQAFEPAPAVDATGVEVDATLSWRPGRKAGSHKVYLSSDPNAVAEGTVAATTVADSSFSPANMEYDTTYYWRVDEVNDADVYEGAVWSFTTQEFAVIDDFESYTDNEDDGTRIYETWVDGYDDDSNGSLVGYLDSLNGTFGETVIIHKGKQSMPVIYDNTSSALSEAVRTFSPAANWTTHGAKSLVVYFRGAPGNTGKLYLKINNVKVPYSGDPAHISSQAWRLWTVDLSTISGANKVTKLTIGLEGAGSKGTVYIDDVRLYREAPEPVDIEILWVSFHEADDTPSTAAAGAGFTEAPDKPYTDALKANGYNVVRYVQTGTPDLDIVNAAKLVIISRSVASGSFQNAAATTWNTVVAPMINLNGYTIRNNRLGFSSGDTIVDITGDIKLTVSVPTHPIFAGISLTNGAMKSPYVGVPTYSNGTAARGLSIVTTATAEPGTLLAAVSTDSSTTGPAGAMVIAEWQAGATVAHAGGAGTDVLGGPRLVFLTGAREADGISGDTAGLYDLSADGAKMFLNAVKYMLEKQ